MTARDQILDLKKRIAADIIGQEEVIEQLLIALLANGHILMEGLPGLAKSLTIANHILANSTRRSTKPTRKAGP